MNRVKWLKDNAKFTAGQIAAVVFLSVLFLSFFAMIRPVLRGLATLEDGEETSLLAVRDRLSEIYGDGTEEREGAVHAFPGQMAYINLNGWMANLMGQHSMNERVRLENGHLTDLSGPQEAETSADEMVELYERQKEKDKHFLFVLTPYQIPKYRDILPAGYEDYGHQSADELLRRLREKDVPVLDLREEMYKQEIWHEDAFFTTDHHWKTQTGFWAYTQIVDYLKQAGIMPAIESRYTDAGQFKVDNYEDVFLGSNGKRTGRYYAGMDDFAVISPRFETDLAMEIPSLGVYRQGEFEQVIYNDNTADYEENSPYDVFTYGGETRSYRNPGAPSDLKIVTVGDSFSWSSAIFLPLVAASCDQLDMRHYRGNFEEYYEEQNPDVVIVFVNASSAAEAINTNYDFFS